MKLIKLVTLFALLTLLAGCNLLIEPENANIPGVGSGFAQVEVRIGGNARTLLPSADFSKYVISAESDDDGYTGEIPSPVEITDEDSGRITIPYGDWIITATAYVNVGGVDYPAAKGSSTITVYGNQSINININAPESGGTGTFAYKVAYPAGGSASVELKPIGGGEAVVNAASVTNGSTVNASVNSGVYFLTVQATASGRTVTRNEVVHIYNMATTEADYVFTKLDFTGSLQIGGTIKVLVNGEQPAGNVELRAHYADNYDYLSISFTGNDDGSATWNHNFNNLRGANTLNFRIRIEPFDEIDILNIPVPVDDKTDIDLGTVNFEPETILLASDTWTDGNFSGNTNYSFYSMNVTAGEIYYLWWNDSEQGDGEKTSDIRVYAYDNNLGSIYFNDNDNAWYEPASFTAGKTGTVYLRVESYSWNNGTYAIAYSTNGIWHNTPFEPPTSVPLAAEGIWTDGNITVNYAEDWYSINVTEGQSYHFWLNSSWYGDDTKTLPAQIYAYKSSGGAIFNSSNAWDNPQSFTADSDDTVYLRVRAYDGWSSTGTYSIMYSTDRWINTDTTTLTADIWVDGTIENNGREWYSIDVINGTTYYIWLNDREDGDGTKTLDAYFNVYNSGGDYLAGDGSAWNNPTQFTVDYTGKAYIEVRTYNWETGTYAIAYGTDKFGDALNRTSPLTAGIWADGTIETYNRGNMYSIDVTNGTTYYIWLNDREDGDGTKTLDAHFNGYNSGGAPIIGTTNAWDSPTQFTADYTGKVYIEVSNSNWGEAGTYAIAYSESNTRP